MKIWGKARRSPKNCLSKPLGLRLTLEELDQVEKYAAGEARSRASFLRILVLVGLAQYERQYKRKLPPVIEVEIKP